MLNIDIHKALHGSQGEISLDIKIEINVGEFVVLMGESGSGKTTLLRVISGLEKAEGEVTVEGKSWKNLAPQQRSIGFVFQDYALFDNMSVEENLLFVNNDTSLAQNLLDLTELRGLSKRNVKTLSGGQKQRVALCRAMMNKPKLLLMDEPLSALDTKMREMLQIEIKKLHKMFGTTTIMVSHDTESAYTLADRIIVLEEGKIVKDGNKDVVFTKVQKVVYSL
jgi:molybdate transport system ATP-binding protein